MLSECEIHWNVLFTLSPESANVDIRYANERGITVTGIRDYGDEGVVEYVVSELVRCLHGFGQETWEDLPREITGLKSE